MYIITELPTRIIADLIVDEETVIELAFEATYDDSGMPTELYLELFLDPYTINLSFVVGTSSVSFEASLTEGSTTILAAGITVTGDLMSEEAEITEVSGYLQYGLIKLEVEVDAQGMFALMTGDTEPTVDELNAEFSAELFDLETDTKLGDFMLVEDSFGHIELAFVFSNGEIANDGFVNDIAEGVNDVIGEMMEQDF